MKATREEIRDEFLDEEVSLEELDNWMGGHGYESVMGDVCPDTLRDDSEITFYSEDGESRAVIGYKDFRYDEGAGEDIFWITSVYVERAED